MTRRPLRVGIADLRRHPGTRRRFHETVTFSGIEISTASVPDDAPIDVDLELETLSNGLVAEGTLQVPWRGECRRCLQMVDGLSNVKVKEIFEPSPTEGETYPMSEDIVDLEPMVRDAVYLALPLAPLCSADCAGPAPESFPTGPERIEESERAPDPRWAALSELHFEKSDDDE